LFDNLFDFLSVGVNRMLSFRLTQPEQCFRDALP